MSYVNLDGKALESEGKDFGPIFPGPGFVENVVITSVEKALDKNQKSYLKISFKNIDTDAILTMMEFAIEDQPDKTPEDTNKKRVSQVTRLKHIISKFYGDTLPAPYGTFEGMLNGVQSFDDIILRVCTLLPPQVLAARKFVVFTHYNYNNYLELPKFVPFLEDLSNPTKVEAFKTKINKTLKDGKMYKMDKDKKETTNPSTLDLGTSTIPDFQIPSSLPKGDDLPF